MTQRQTEIPHSQAKVGYCPFCKTDSAELWFDPNETWERFQVRCSACGACGPTADCGWESAVPCWDQVRASGTDDITWRGPGSGNPDPHAPPLPPNT